MSRLVSLDLFSGIGGFALGFERAGIQTAMLCEIGPFPRRVLRAILSVESSMAGESK